MADLPTCNRYSNTIIYKIICNDPNIHDLYVGSTIHFENRKYQHKKACKDINNAVKIYRIIRENGGWENWNMLPIATYNCANGTEARKREQEHYEQLSATMNSNFPYGINKTFSCQTCNVSFNSNKILRLHYRDKHTKIKMRSNEIIPNPEKFSCSDCNYFTDSKKDFWKHEQTKKHIIKTNKTVESSVEPSNKTFVCVCDKKYNHASSLCKHRKTCTKLQGMKNEKEPAINKSQLLQTIVNLSNEILNIQNKILTITNIIMNQNSD
jgi:hypothetical protein